MDSVVSHTVKLLSWMMSGIACSLTAPAAILHTIHLPLYLTLQWDGLICMCLGWVIMTLLESHG